MVAVVYSGLFCWCCLCLELLLGLLSLFVVDSCILSTKLLACFDCGGLSWRWGSCSGISVTSFVLLLLVLLGLCLI